MNTSSFYRYLVGGLACFAALLCFTSVYAAAENKLSEPEEREALKVDVDDMLQPWKGDLPGMLDRRTIRVLTTFSKTFFFINKGTQRGATHDIFMEFERSLNQSLAKEKKLKHRHLKVRIIFVPVARDQLISALNAGKGDIIAANLTITPARQH
jgi:ABC-type amino acid transport substrate-binding protein